MVYGIESAMRDGSDAPAPCCGACGHWMELRGGCGLCRRRWELCPEATAEAVEACLTDECDGPCAAYEEG